jgi:type II secretory pathway predicted ATPase ExeA
MSSHKESRAPAVYPKVRDWFGLRENPFRDNASADYYFPLPFHERAIDHCIRSVVNQTGMPLIHGPEGTGKSMLGTKLRARFAEGSSGLSFKTHVIDGSVHSRSSTPALRELSLALGGRKTTPNYRLYDEIETSATAKLESGTCVVVLLERAELFQDDMMRMVLFLWNLVTRDGSQFLVRLIAFGRPDYLRTLEKTKYANIRSRTVFGAPGLKAFTPEELASVVRHRLTVAGGQADVFDDDALQEIHRISAGNPRRALATASRALVASHKSSVRAVGPDIVRSIEALVR